MEAFQVNLSEEELKRLERQAGGKPEEPDSSIPNEEKPRPSIDLQRLRWWDKPSEKSKFQFFLYLKTMISAGFPFLEAIENSSSPEDDPIFHEIVQDVAQRVSGGHTISAALRHHPDVFSQFQCRMLEVGEKKGQIIPVLTRLAGDEEKRQQLFRKVLGQITYPLITLALAVPLAILIGGLVLKPVQEILAGFGEALPVPAQILVKIFDFCSHPAGLTLIFLSLLGLFWMYKCRLFLFNEGNYTRLLLRLPYIRRPLHDVYALRLLETLLLQLQSGETLDKALATSFKASGHPIWSSAAGSALNWIRQGNDSGSALFWLYEFLQVHSQMFLQGIESGTVESSLKQSIFLLEISLEANIQRMTAALQPAIMLGMGLLSGAIILSVMLPLTRIMEVVT